MACFGERRDGDIRNVLGIDGGLADLAHRTWIGRAPDGQSGWLGALRDRQIGRAIALIHRDPAVNWTLRSLAAEVGMSRSAFAARFTELVGEPVMRYATRWKMHTAELWLRESPAPLWQLANRLGYESEAAFSRAFTRAVGLSPGALRRRSAALPGPDTRPAPES